MHEKEHLLQIVNQTCSNRCEMRIKINVQHSLEGNTLEK